MKKPAFALLGTMIILLITGSMTEQFCGTAAAVKLVYTAPWTIVLWALTIIVSLCYIMQQKVYKIPAVFLLHFSFAVILGGALFTHCLGKQGHIHLRLEEPDNKTLPFIIELKDFEVSYYTGTHAPMDYTSLIEINDKGNIVTGSVSMNKVFTYRHYRFYQSRYDSDQQGTVLTYNHDPIGIGITYIGYAMLLLSMLMFFFSHRTRFSALLRKAALSCMLLFAVLTPAIAAQTTLPPALHREVAASFGELYVYHNNRVCPIQTLAHDFTVKIYGKPEYKELTSEQVLTGWLYEYNQWSKEKMIKIKGDDVRRALGIEGRYACLNDFVGKGQYKLDSLLTAGNKNARLADEKFRIISTIATGTALRTLPYTTSDGSILWVAVSDKLPKDISYADVQVMTGGWNYIAMLVATGTDEEIISTLDKLRGWQIKKAGTTNLPSEKIMRLEVAYNRFEYVRPLSMTCAFIGIIGFIVSCLLISRRKTMPQPLQIGLICVMVIVWAVISLGLVMRWIISGHIPLSNGHETMQFMAWATSLLSIGGSIYAIIRHKQVSLLLSAGFLVCGMTLMVSMMAGSNPQITQLMPVLQSPLLTIHVAVIMIAYCLLAFIMLNGVAALVLWAVNPLFVSRNSDEGIARLQLISQLLLYPAVFCLTIGIFIGAVWANISWGRYWGWDPKEVWALITMMVYAVPLHASSLRSFQNPVFFHAYSIVAFIFVLITYFGVNYLLGGMHSYA